MDISKEIKNAARGITQRVKRDASFLIPAPLVAYSLYCLITGYVDAGILFMLIGLGGGGICDIACTASRPVNPIATEQVARNTK